MVKENNQDEKENTAEIFRSQTSDSQWLEEGNDLVSGETLKARKWETERRLVDDSSSYGNLHVGTEEDKGLEKDGAVSIVPGGSPLVVDTLDEASRGVMETEISADPEILAGVGDDQFLIADEEQMTSGAIGGSAAAFPEMLGSLGQNLPSDAVGNLIPVSEVLLAGESAEGSDIAERQQLEDLLQSPAVEVFGSEEAIPSAGRQGIFQLPEETENSGSALQEDELGFDSTTDLGADSIPVPENVAAVIEGAGGEIFEDEDRLVSGRLTITDSDAGEASFVPTNIHGAYGDFQIDGDGAWTFALDNDSETLQTLSVGGRLTETVQVVSVDGTTHDLAITIHGTNDVPRIGTITTRTATEDGEAIYGQIRATDIDSGDTLSYSTTLTADGLVFNSDGSYSFDPGHADYQFLATGETRAISIPVTATDSHGASTTETLVITLQGTNDVPTVAGAVTLPVGSEDTIQSFTVEQLLARVEDLDSTDNHRISQISVDPSQGTLTLQNGVYTFTPAPNYHGEVSLSYTVTDQSGSIVQAQASLDVTAVNDKVGPLADMDASRNTVMENAVNGTVVHLTAQAVDVDGDSVRYALVDGEGRSVSDGPFAVDSTTGVVTVRDRSKLDYETSASHQLHIQATSADGSTSTEAFTVAVGDATIMQVTDLGGASNGTPVTLNITGDHYDPKNIDDAGSAGAPQFRIKVNGEYVSLNGQTTFTASANTGHLVATNKDLTGDGVNDLQMVYNANDSELFIFRLPAGTAIDSVSVQFLNDAYDGASANNDRDNVLGEDRNLVVREMNIGGTILSDGTITGGVTYQAEDKAVSQYLASNTTDVSGREVMPWSGTMTFYPDGVPVAPTSEDSVLTTIEDTGITLKSSDFHFADQNAGDSLAAVRITAMGEHGSLSLDGQNVALHQEISKADIDSGKLVYTPSEDLSGKGISAFDFQVSDGHQWSAGTNTVSLDITPVADTPLFDISPVTGVAGTTFDLSARVSLADLDGSEVLSSVTVSGVPPGAVLSAGTMISGGVPADYQATTLGIQQSGQLSVVFEGETAGYKNSFGYYKVDPVTKEISDVQMIWSNASLKGSGGDLTAGESSADLDATAGDTLGFFIVADGSSKNTFSNLGEGHYQFRTGNGQNATTDSKSPALVFIAASGAITTIKGDVFHTVDGTDNYSLNPDGIRHTRGELDLDEGAVTLGFEDLRGGGDRDFDDCIFTVHVGEANAEALLATNQGFSTWQLAPGELEGLQITLPENYAEDFSLTLTATSTELSGESATITTEIPVTLIEPSAEVAAEVSEIGSDLPSITLTMENVDGRSVQDSVIEYAPSDPAGVTGDGDSSGTGQNESETLSSNTADTGEETDMTVSGVDVSSEGQEAGGGEQPASQANGELDAYSTSKASSAADTSESSELDSYDTSSGDTAQSEIPPMDGEGAGSEGQAPQTPGDCGLSDADVPPPDDAQTDLGTVTEEVGTA